MFREVVLMIGGRELAKMRRDDIPPEGRHLHIGDSIYGKSAVYVVERVVEAWSSSIAHTSVTAQAAGDAFDLAPGTVYVHVKHVPADKAALEDL